ncbi:MAG: hypothetical protein WBO69_07765 [Thermoanaerobaculia bacterium]|jgi:hypothetical protein
MTSIKKIAVFAVAFVAATSLHAQDPVKHLQDLKGALGRDGEYQMQQRGYTHVRTEKSDDSAFSFWTDNRYGYCVQVTTTDGRYASIVYSPAADCEESDDDRQATAEREETFDTLCGSAVDGKITRYRCEVTDYFLADGRKRTTLRFPDMEMTFRWHSDKNVGVEREGMDTVQANYKSSEGSHEIFVDGMTYFYAYDKEEAERRLQKFNK